MEDFIKKLGYKALDTRFKRISENMSHDIRKLYRELDLGVEPNWYLIFMVLKEHHKLSIVEIATLLNYAHPSVVMIIKKMKAADFIHTTQDAQDKRKQLISLTSKSVALLPQLETLWKSCELAILELIENDTQIVTYLDDIDASLKTISFHERFKNQYSIHQA